VSVLFRNVPEHERIVPLRGSIIEYTMSGGGQSVALLIMDRLKWDFHAAIKKQLCWTSRLVVDIHIL